ncbi:unnamed protein product [Pleuronectes platessa]|uniref:Uncharacterized protein n=1 Tax=Pleuronectes platessa TaxID=8262 RepID=A0A9N7VHD8_PLEPL|nr:unnamed protein product [Pleuronectes platessa]
MATSPGGALTPGPSSQTHHSHVLEILPLQRVVFCRWEEASTPFLAHQPPSSPRSYPTALPSRSIPQAVHTEAYCVCRQTAERQHTVRAAAEREDVWSCTLCDRLLLQGTSIFS